MSFDQPQHPEYQMVALEESKESDTVYTSPTYSPVDDYRQFAPACKYNYTPEKAQWELPEKRYQLPNQSFLPDGMVQGYNDDRFDRIAKLEKLVEELRLQQSLNALPKKQRKRATIEVDKSIIIKNRLRKKLEEKREAKENFINI